MSSTTNAAPTTEPTPTETETPKPKRNRAAAAAPKTDAAPTPTKSAKSTPKSAAPKSADDVTPKPSAKTADRKRKNAAADKPSKSTEPKTPPKPRTMADESVADVTRRANAVLVEMLDGKSRAPISSKQMSVLASALSEPHARIVEALDALADDGKRHKLTTSGGAIAPADVLKLNKTHGRKLRVVKREVVGVKLDECKRELAAISTVCFGGTSAGLIAPNSVGRNKMRGAKMVAALSALAERDYNAADAKPSK